MVLPGQLGAASPLPTPLQMAYPPLSVCTVPTVPTMPKLPICTSWTTVHFSWE